MTQRVDAARDALVKLAALPGPPSEVSDLEALLTAAAELTAVREQTLGEIRRLTPDQQTALARHVETREALALIERRTGDWERAMRRGREAASNRVQALRTLRQRRRQR